LAHPGGTITGLSNYNSEMAGKWLEMLMQISPAVARVAILYNPATAPYAGLYLHALDNAARSLALTVQVAPVRDDAGIEAVMTALAREQRAERWLCRTSSSMLVLIAMQLSASRPDTACPRSSPLALSREQAG
jgi:ABC-type uncharacterized transport system substrate-binding protein